MSKICILLAVLGLPTTVAAQTAPAASDPASEAWSSKWTVTVAPSLGADRALASPFPVGDEIVDDSEYSISAALTRNFQNGVSLTFSPAASYSPNQFDPEEPASALSFGTTLKGPVGETDGLLHRLSWVASARLRAEFDETFEAHVRTGRTFGLGLEFSNAGAPECDAGQTPGCRPRGALIYKITPELQWLESSADAQDLFNPRLRVELSVAPFYLEAAVDSRLYDNLLAPDGDQRGDSRLSATAGLDLTAAMKRAFRTPPELSLRLGARWTAVSSNDPDAESDRVYLAPELAWKQQF
jgi:hypothetical protein